MNGPRFSVRRASDEDRSAIKILVSAMAGHDASARLTSLYANNPHGGAKSWVAVDVGSNDVVGVASVFPREVMVDGVPTRACIGGDCYVAPRARKQGLATRLHRATRADLPALGLDFVYGPALPENLRALLRAGSREVTTFRRFVRPLTREFLSDHFTKLLPRRLSRVSSGLAPRLLGRAVGLALLRGRLPKDLVAAPADRFGPEWDAWHRANAPTSGVFCSRDSAYMNHRYQASGSGTLRAYTLRFRGTLDGMFVLRLGEGRKTCSLMDFMTRFDTDAMRMGLRLACQAALELDCDALTVSSTPHALFTRALAAEGFFARDQAAPLEFPLLVPESVQPVGSLFLGSAWYFLEGDLDASVPSIPSPMQAVTRD